MRSFYHNGDDQTVFLQEKKELKRQIDQDKNWLVDLQERIEANESRLTRSERNFTISFDKGRREAERLIENTKIMDESLSGCIIQPSAAMNDMP